MGAGAESTRDICAQQWRRHMTQAKLLRDKAETLELPEYNHTTVCGRAIYHRRPLIVSLFLSHNLPRPFLCHRQSSFLLLWPPHLKTARLQLFDSTMDELELLLLYVRLHRALVRRETHPLGSTVLSYRFHTPVPLIFLAQFPE